MTRRAFTRPADSESTPSACCWCGQARLRSSRPTSLPSARVGPPARPLRGLATLHVAPDQVLVQSRARQAALAAAKRAMLVAPADAPHDVLHEDAP